MFWSFGCKACGILAPRPRIKPLPPALEDEVLLTGKSWYTFDFRVMLGLQKNWAEIREFPYTPSLLQIMIKQILFLPTAKH